MDAPLEPCLSHNRHLTKFVEWISMRELNESLFSDGILKDPLGWRWRQGDKQTLNIKHLPRSCSWPQPPAYYHWLYIIRLPRAHYFRVRKGLRQDQPYIVGSHDVAPLRWHLMTNTLSHLYHKCKGLPQKLWAPTSELTNYLPTLDSPRGFIFATATRLLQNLKTREEWPPRFSASPGWWTACFLPHSSSRVRLDGSQAGVLSQSHTYGHRYTPQPNNLHRRKTDSLPQDTAVEAIFICKISHVP